MAYNERHFKFINAMLTQCYVSIRIWRPNLFIHLFNSGNVAHRTHTCR